jgi:hypothetical protein
MIFIVMVMLAGVQALGFASGSTETANQQTAVVPFSREVTFTKWFEYVGSA